MLGDPDLCPDCGRPLVALVLSILSSVARRLVSVQWPSENISCHRENMDTRFLREAPGNKIDNQEQYIMKTGRRTCPDSERTAEPPE